jgi:YegS/Rv2252/BmrU family lipid kinase
MHAARLVQKAPTEGFDVVVAAGGDGTCNEIVNGLMGLPDAAPRPALGVLCIGRGNDFAFGAGIPHPLEEGVRVLAAGKRRRLDVGKLTGCGEIDPRFFCNGIGVGFDTIVGLEAAKMKHVGSFVGYILGALKTIITFPEAPTVRLAYGSNELNEQAIQISIMVGRRMGGAFYMCPHSISDDGELDFCMAGRVGRGKMVGLFLKFLKGTQEESPDITSGRSTSFDLTAVEGPLLVHADGETICTEGKRLSVECVPKALEVVTAVE